MEGKYFSLFAKPSLLEGVARLIDICGLLNTYNSSKSDEEADYRAIVADWYSLNQDFHAVIGQLETEQPKCIEYGR